MEVIGFHGTTVSSHNSILERGFDPNRGTRPCWLGRGVYFYQDASFHARSWALSKSTMRGVDDAVVLRASLKLPSPDESYDHIIEGFERGANLQKKKNVFIDLTDGGYWSIFRDMLRQLSPIDDIQLGPEALFRDLTDEESRSLYYNIEDDKRVTDLIAVLNRVVRVVAVRAAFIEGKPLFGRSWLFDQSHVQICVRDPVVVLNPEWFRVGRDFELIPFD